MLSPVGTVAEDSLLNSGSSPCGSPFSTFDSYVTQPWPAVEERGGTGLFAGLQSGDLSSRPVSATTGDRSYPDPVSSFSKWKLSLFC